MWRFRHINSFISLRVVSDMLLMSFHGCIESYYGLRMSLGFVFYEVIPMIYRQLLIAGFVLLFIFISMPKIIEPSFDV